MASYMQDLLIGIYKVEVKSFSEMLCCMRLTITLVPASTLYLLRGKDL